MSIYRNIDLDETGIVIKATSATLQRYFIANRHATQEEFVKLYNQSTAPGIGDIPALTIPLSPGEKANCNFEGPPGTGWEFPNGLSIRATVGIADNDAVGPSTNDIVVNIGYR